MTNRAIPGAGLISFLFPSIQERERAADGDLSVAEESPPTHRARSRTQVRVARVTAMAQKRHGLFSVMMRLSPQGEKHGLHASNPLSVNKQDTVKRRIPAGASQNRTMERSVSVRVWRRAECR